MSVVDIRLLLDTHVVDHKPDSIPSWVSFWGTYAAPTAQYSASSRTRNESCSHDHTQMSPVAPVASGHRQDLSLRPAGSAHWAVASRTLIRVQRRTQEPVMHMGLSMQVCSVQLSVSKTWCMYAYNKPPADRNPRSRPSCTVWTAFLAGRRLTHPSQARRGSTQLGGDFSAHLSTTHLIQPPPSFLPPPSSPLDTLSNGRRARRQDAGDLLRAEPVPRAHQEYVPATGR